MFLHQTLTLVLVIAVLGGCNVAERKTTEVPPVEVSATPSPPAARRPPTEVDLTINGVRMGTSETKVLALLGKPQKVKDDGFEECSSGYVRSFHYDNLEIVLLSDARRRNYSVIDIELTSDKWEIEPGLRVGDPIERVREIFGEPNYPEDSNGLMYVTKDNLGGVDFYAQDGKLIRVRARQTLC